MNTYSAESTTIASAEVSNSGLFRTADGKNFALIFALITSLFLLWGFCNGMIDILNKHFQDTLHINKEQSGLVQAANYLAYFLMAIPGGFDCKEVWLQGRHSRRFVVDRVRRSLVHSCDAHRHVLGVSAGLIHHRSGYDLSRNHR